MFTQVGFNVGEAQNLADVYIYKMLKINILLRG